jgi:hypothetical protein
MPEGQQHKNGYHTINNIWHPERILLIIVSLFYGVINLSKFQ